jgi:hypothetical protein
MLQLKKCNVDDLKGYIDIAFKEDVDLFKYFDTSIQVSSTKEMVESVFIKVKDYYKFFLECTSFGVYSEDNPIGYFFILKNPNLLVSFSINKEYRNSETLSSYFDLIKEQFKEDFSCFLYTHNKRAINWLKKCGMVESKEKFEIDFIKLNYKKCP